MKTQNITTLTKFYNKTKSDAKTTNLYTSDMITYSAEREYPPKTFDSKIEETTTIEILNKTSFKETIILNTYDLNYGSGTYEIYSSTTHPDTTRCKFLLFNKIFSIDGTTSFEGALWELNNYDTNTGNHKKLNFIAPGYFGDWIISKLPYPIILTFFF